MVGDARRLRAHRRQRRRARRQPAAWRQDRRRLGALRRAGRGDDVAADARAHFHPARRGRAAEPRRRQPVLGRALRRARRGDAAAGAGPDPPDDRLRRRRGKPDRAHRRPAGSLEREFERHSRQQGEPGGACGAAGRLRRFAAQSGAGCARGGVGDPRPLFARCLARAQRSGGGDCRAAADRSLGRLDAGARRAGASDHLVVLRPGKRKHDEAGRLAVPRARPPDRAGGRDLPLHPAVRRHARAGCCARCPARTCATARSLTGSATS